MMSRDVAILMADLSGYTATTEIHGSESALEIIKTFMRIAGESLHNTSRILERIGDQIVIVSESADDAAITANKLLSRCHKEINFLPIHVGLHYGTVLQSEGSFYGTVINVAARLASEANKGEILCSEAFTNALIDKQDFMFGEFRSLKFKNIMHPIRVAVLMGVDIHPLHNLDPVCKMNLGPNATHSVVYEGIIYHFCSEECMHIFNANPRLFFAN
jgi:adenylate cyclase